MSNSDVTTIVVGVVNIAGLVIGFLTLWVKLRYADTNAREAVVRAMVVEKKLDNNTRTTESVDLKASTIVDQTNGTLTQMHALIEKVAERVSKLEDYNRESSHRLFDTINALALKMERLLVAQEIKQPAPAPAEGTK